MNKDKTTMKNLEEASKKASAELAHKDILEVLLDENNKEPIVLLDENGRKLTFEQIAVIPHNDKIYCVLKPVDKIADVADDEAIVFFVEEGDGQEPVLKVETDEKTAMDIFDEYYNLLDEAEKNSKK